MHKKYWLLQHFMIQITLEQLVRVTIQTEPLHSKDIMSSTMTSYPDRMIDILSGLIQGDS